MKKNIVFDMGNVLLSYQPKEMIKKYVKNNTEQKILFEAIFHSIHWLKFDRGTLKKDELKYLISQQVPDYLEAKVIEILDNWYNDIHPINEMAPLIISLKEKGYKLFILSNASSDFHEFKYKIPCFDLFDGVFLSSDWKMLKPEKEIYQAFYAQFQLNPSECFFIDDMPANIESALNTGMDGFIFRNDFQQLENAFTRL